MKKRLAMLLSAVMVIGSTMTVYADESQTILQEEVAQDTQVTYTSAATYSITLPKTVNLSGDSTDYTVSVKGNIGGDDVISITPQDGDNGTDGTNILLSDIASTNRQPDIVVNVVQNKTSFNATEVGVLQDSTLVGTSTTGTLSLASTPKDGVSYSGILRFTVECTSSSRTYAEKVALMSTLQLYGAGDSVMEGYGNEYVGTMDYLEKMYGANVLKDYSVSGATLSNVEGYNVTSVGSQIGQLLARMSYETPTNKTVIVWDGGGNDYMQVIKDATEAGEDANAAATNYLKNKLPSAMSTAYSAISGKYVEKGVNDFVMVYIIPSVKANAGAEGSSAFAFTLKSIWSNTPDHVLVVDCNEILTVDDYQSDGLHWNDAGYRKVSAKIVDALYNHYNP